MLVRRLARPMLSSIFVVAGFNSVRNPDRVAPAAAPVVDKLRSLLPQQVSSLIPADPATAARVNGAVHVVGGLLLATGKFPRFASLTLAGSLVPTTLAGHAFWQEDDPAKRAQQQVHFFKNLSLMGGLLIAAVDTEGKPSAAWRGREAAHRAAAALPSGSDSSDTVSSLKDTVSNVAEAAKEHSAHLASVAKEQAPVVAEAVREKSEAVAEAAKEQAPFVAEAVRERGGKASRRAAKQASKAAQQARAQFA